MPDPALLAVIVFVLVLGALTLLGSAQEHEAIERRLTQPSPVARGPRTYSVLRPEAPSRVPWLVDVVGRFDFAARLGRDLARAGLPVRAEEFVFLQLVVAALAGVAGFIFLRAALGPLIAAGSVAIVGYLAPLLWLRFRLRQRLDQFEQALPEALDLVSGSLRAGYGVAHGLDVVAREMSGPVAEEFGQMLIELNLGDDLEHALARLIERVDSEDARLLATAVAVQRRTGGNLVEVLESMTETIRQRIRIRREIRVITTGPRLSGYVVAALPVLTAGFMYLTSRYYLEILFNQPIGRVLLVFSGLLVLIGLYINHRIVNIDV